MSIAKRDGTFHTTKITKLYSFEGLKRVDETIGRPGDMLAIAGVEGITIGETVTSAETPAPLPPSTSTSRPSPWPSPSTRRRSPGAKDSG